MIETPSCGLRQCLSEKTVCVQENRTKKEQKIHSCPVRIVSDYATFAIDSGQ